MESRSGAYGEAEGGEIGGGGGGRCRWCDKCGFVGYLG